MPRQLQTVTRSGFLIGLSNFGLRLRFLPLESILSQASRTKPQGEERLCRYELQSGRLRRMNLINAGCCLSCRTRQDSARLIHVRRSYMVVRCSIGNLGEQGVRQRVATDLRLREEQGHTRYNYRMMSMLVCCFERVSTLTV